MEIKTITEGRATGVLINGTVHVLKRSSSSYGLNIHGTRNQYCCQDGCCDRGLQPDVALVVMRAKEFGATKVVVRTGQRSNYVGVIAELPVEDVSNHVGQISESVFIDRRR